MDGMDRMDRMDRGKNAPSIMSIPSTANHLKKLSFFGKIFLERKLEMCPTILNFEVIRCSD